MPIFSRFKLTTLAIALLSTSSIYAETQTILPTIATSAQNDPSKNYTAVKDDSTLRTKQKNLDIPQTVNVVSSKYLADYDPSNLDEALSQVSGITQGNTLAGTQDTIMKRGFGDNRDGSIMVNGMPVVQGRVMNASVEKVEVLKGPASLLYGIMDPGGVVNAVTKKPQQKQSTVLYVYGSSYARGKNGAGATIDTTGQIGSSHFSYRLIADQSHKDYWRNFGYNNQQLIAPSIQWTNDTTTFNLSYQYHKFDVPFDRSTIVDRFGTGKVLPISKYTRLDQASNQMSGEDHLAQLTMDHQLSEQWQLHAGYSYNKETYDANQMRVVPGSLNTTTHTLKRSSDATTGANSISSFGQAYLNGDTSVFGLRHNIQLGVESAYVKYYRKDLWRTTTANQKTINYETLAGTDASMVSSIDASASDQTNKLHTYGMYLQDSIYLTDQWIAVLGGRYTHWQQTAGKGRPFVLNTNTDAGKWLPRFGLVYKVNDQTSIYASYTESLKPSWTIAGYKSQLDSSVPPEEGKSYEIGLKYELGQRFTTNIALYDIKKTNIIDNDTVTSISTAQDARSKGLEIDMTGRITDKLDAIATYAYTYAKVTDSTNTTAIGKYLANVAKNTASLSLSYDYGQFANGQLRFGASGNYVGNRAGDQSNNFKLPDYALMNAFVSYDTKLSGQDLNLKLNVNNLFDKDYLTSTTATDSTAYLNVSRGDAREFVLKATMKF
ncbi:TonB-dependent siderophore receptor [Acinetobacter rathckeae]|uniref:TonB-dependent siderophore receptor n=1 Tax=Acinetobacter rathckeae TaxID=2605272 RepID=UPI0018A25DCA|nr:TonB-dependent siderophore receptor [Acinetobacter rathckeae]MBF7694568.1 TonB-dependent siderophore receptor [Acinetobacter rathckeae]